MGFRRQEPWPYFSMVASELKTVPDAYYVLIIRDVWMGGE